MPKNENIKIEMPDPVLAERAQKITNDAIDLMMKFMEPQEIGGLLTGIGMRLLRERGLSDDAVLGLVDIMLHLQSAEAIH